MTKEAQPGTQRRARAGESLGAHAPEDASQAAGAVAVATLGLERPPKHVPTGRAQVFLLQPRAQQRLGESGQLRIQGSRRSHSGRSHETETPVQVQAWERENVKVGKAAHYSCSMYSRCQAGSTEAGPKRQGLEDHLNASQEAVCPSPVHSSPSGTPESTLSCPCRDRLP